MAYIFDDRRQAAAPASGQTLIGALIDRSGCAVFRFFSPLLQRERVLGVKRWIVQKNSGEMSF
jgi:hypothetical protein